MDISATVSSITSVGFLFTAATALFIYYNSRNDASLSRRKEIRARLSEFYFNYHNELLKTHQNVRMAQELFFREYSTEQTEKILFMYMFLNAAHFEWHMSKTYDHPQAAFQATLDGLFGRFVGGAGARDQFLITDFDRLYSDFPENFRKEVHECISRHRPKSEELTAKSLPTTPQSKEKI